MSEEMNVRQLLQPEQVHGGALREFVVETYPECEVLLQEQKTQSFLHHKFIKLNSLTGTSPRGSKLIECNSFGF